jgi:hypothetical protein
LQEGRERLAVAVAQPCMSNLDGRNMAQLGLDPPERGRGLWLALLVRWAGALVMGTGVAILIWISVSSWTFNLWAPSEYKSPREPMQDGMRPT